MNEQTFLSLFSGFIGGLISIPLNAFFAYFLKRDELSYAHKLDIIADRRKLLLEHKLEMQKKGRDTEINSLIRRLEKIESGSKS